MFKNFSIHTASISAIGSQLGFQWPLACKLSEMGVAACWGVAGVVMGWIRVKGVGII
jgi:hypothetical protein